MHLFVYVTTRGGVESIRLEAKDTKKSEAKAKDAPSEERPCRGQGQDCLKTRTKTKDTMQKCSPPPKKKVFAKTFANFPQKSCVKIFFSQVLWRAPRRNYIAHDLRSFSTGQKIVLSSSRGQGIFEDLQGSRPRPRT